MMKSLVVALVLIAAGSAVDPYPHYEVVLRNPKDFDLMFSSNSGPVNESWYFNVGVNLTSIVIPSQIFNFSCTGGTYEEEIDIFLFEVKTLWGRSSEPYLVASGSFSGTVEFGQKLSIPLRNGTVDAPPPVGWYDSYNGYDYTLSIVFKKTGIYPWYTQRTFAEYSAVHAYTNGPGISIGLTYAAKRA